MMDDANGQFEKLAAQFQEDTGYLSPGKDFPVAAGPDNYELRCAVWEVWLKMRERLKEAQDTNQKGLARNGLVGNGRDAYSNENGELRERVEALEGFVDSMKKRYPNSGWIRQWADEALGVSEDSPTVEGE